MVFTMFEFLKTLVIFAFQVSFEDTTLGGVEKMHSKLIYRIQYSTTEYTFFPIADITQIYILMIPIVLKAYTR